MENFINTNNAGGTPTMSGAGGTGGSENHSVKKIILGATVVLVVIIFVFYRPEVKTLWNSSKGKIQNLLAFIDRKNESAPEAPAAPAPVAKISCGTTTSADANVASDYENDQVLNCLGDAARSCSEAEGILEVSFFPTIFEVVKSQNGCNFKLSYAADIKLVDIQGKNLAGQSITCPISIVKSMKESGSTTIFAEPNVTNAEKYAAEIYSYGTIGVFIEANLDRNAIFARGCSGDYIDSLIKSYQAVQN